MDKQKFVKAAACTVGCLIVGAVWYHPYSPSGNLYWKTGTNHGHAGFDKVPWTAAGVTAVMMFAMAAMLEQLQRIDHVGFDEAFASDYKLGYLGLSTRVSAIILVLLLPHVLMEGRCLLLFGLDRAYDFLAMTTMCLVLRQMKAICEKMHSHQK